MKSMTGYGKSSFINESYEIEVEVKSVNHKGFDLKMLSCRELFFIDNEIREIVYSSIKRGKVDVRISFRDKRVPVIEVDENRVKAYYQMLLKVKASLGIDEPIKLDSIVGQENVIVIQQTDYDNEDFRKALFGCLKEAIKKHQALACKEGEALKSFFVDSFDSIEECLKRVKETIPAYREKLKASLVSAVKQILNSDLNEDVERRVLVETALYIEKCDITEELIRMESHLANIRDSMATGLDSSDIGKSMGFILQEMQREGNTISSKYNVSETFADVLKIKETIERCREQIQNVE